MGCWVARLLKDCGMAITICDKREEAAIETAQELGVTSKPIDRACIDSDVVVVCVPMDTLVQVCQEVGAHMRQGSLLVEISSVKTGVSDVLSGILPDHIGYVSLHPLFGPETTTLEGQNVVAVKTRDDEWTRRVVDFLERNGAVVTTLDIKDHDYIMSVFQVLHHFSMLSFARAIDTFTPNHLMKKELVTQSLRSTLGSEATILRNLPTVIEIQKVNPFSEEIRARFLSEVQKMLEEDPDLLRGQLEETAKRISTLV